MFKIINKVFSIIFIIIGVLGLALLFVSLCNYSSIQGIVALLNTICGVVLMAVFLWVILLCIAAIIWVLKGGDEC